MPGRNWLIGAIAAVALSQAGCVTCCHKGYEKSLASGPECELPTACRNQVYVFLINGVTPPTHNGLNALRMKLGENGFAKVGIADLAGALSVEHEIKKIRACEPDAKFVLVGYDVGAPAAICDARHLASKDIPVEAVVLLDPVGTKEVCCVPTLLIASGKKPCTVPHSKQIVVPDASHFTLPVAPAHGRDAHGPAFHDRVERLPGDQRPGAGVVVQERPGNAPGADRPLGRRVGLPERQRPDATDRDQHRDPAVAANRHTHDRRGCYGQEVVTTPDAGSALYCGSMKLKQRPEDFVVEELTDATPGDAGEFAFYRLDKTGWTTPDALSAVRRRWQIDGRRLSYGGLKDRHAVTAQHVTVFRGPTRNLSHERVTLTYLGQRAEPFTRKRHPRQSLRDYPARDDRRRGVARGSGRCARSPPPGYPTTSTTSGSARWESRASSWRRKWSSDGSNARCGSPSPPRMSSTAPRRSAKN
jgi:hypothetical protein